MHVCDPNNSQLILLDADLITGFVAPSVDVSGTYLNSYQTIKLSAESHVRNPHFSRQKSRTGKGAPDDISVHHIDQTGLF